MQIYELSNEVERVSAFYAERHGIDRTDDWFVLKLNEEVGELTQAYLAAPGRRATRDAPTSSSKATSGPSWRMCSRKCS